MTDTYKTILINYLLDITDDEFQIRKISIFMRQNEKNHGKEIFKIWLRFYENSYDNVNNMLIYLFIVHECVIKGYLSNETILLRIFGDNMFLIFDLICQITNDKIIFRKLNHIIDSWEQLKIYDTNFLRKIRHKINCWEMNPNNPKVNEEAENKVHFLKENELIESCVLANSNEKIILTNYSFINKIFNIGEQSLINKSRSLLLLEEYKRMIVWDIIFRNKLILSYAEYGKINFSSKISK